MVWQQIVDQMRHFKGWRVVLNVADGLMSYEWEGTLDFAREGVKVIQWVSTGTRLGAT